MRKLSFLSNVAWISQFDPLCGGRGGRVGGHSRFIDLTRSSRVDMVITYHNPSLSRAATFVLCKNLPIQYAEFERSFAFLTFSLSFVRVPAADISKADSFFFLFPELLGLISIERHLKRTPLRTSWKTCFERTSCRTLVVKFRPATRNEPFTLKASHRVLLFKSRYLACRS